MSKHTPGPWFICPNGSGFEVDSASGKSVAKAIQTCPELNSNSISERMANAHLIAAAPELLEALGTLLNRLEGIGGEHVTGMEGIDADLMKANAVIAKATGAEQ